jgi:hypothetical protein
MKSRKIKIIQNKQHSKSKREKTLTEEQVLKTDKNKNQKTTLTPQKKRRR